MSTYTHTHTYACFPYMACVSLLRLLMSLFAEGKAWELQSLLTSAEQKVGVAHKENGGQAGGIPDEATPPSFKTGKISRSR